MVVTKLKITSLVCLGPNRFVKISTCFDNLWVKFYNIFEMWLPLFQHRQFSTMYHVTDLNYIHVKICEPRLILNLLCFLCLIIHELGLGGKGN